MSQNKEIETQLRIIHACEKGATGVYYGHRIIAKLFFRDMITTLDEMHRHETEHFYWGCSRLAEVLLYENEDKSL